jgi:hypothetical protein
MRLIPDGDFDNVVTEMNQALKEVETGEITTPRSVEIDRCVQMARSSPCTTVS